MSTREGKFTDKFRVTISLRSGVKDIQSEEQKNLRIVMRTW